jgi:hypothetical protein
LAYEEVSSAAVVSAYQIPGELKKQHRAFLHRENPTFKIWQRMRFVAVFRSYGKGHKKFKCLQ